MTCIHFDPERFAKLAVDKRKENRTNDQYCQILDGRSIGPMKYFYLQERVFHRSPSGVFANILLGEEVTSYSLGRGEGGVSKLVSKGISASSKSKEMKRNDRPQDPDEQLLEEALNAANKERASGAGPSNQPLQKAPQGKGRLRKMREENTRRGEQFDTEFGRLLEQGLASARNVLGTSNRLREEMGPASRSETDDSHINRLLDTAQSSLAAASRILSAVIQ